MAMEWERLRRVVSSTRWGPKKESAEVGMTMATLAMKSRLQHALFTIMLKLCCLYFEPPHRKQKPAQAPATQPQSHSSPGNLHALYSVHDD